MSEFSPLPSNETKPKSAKSHTLLVGLGALVIAGSILYIFSSSLFPPPSEETSTVPSDIEEFENSSIVAAPSGETVSEQVLRQDQNDYTTNYKDVKRQEGVEWFLHPVYKGNLAYVAGKPENEWAENIPYHYFQLGSYQGKPITFLTIECDGPCFSREYLTFVGNKETGISLLTKHSSYDLNGEYSYLNLEHGVVVDSQLSLEALAIPEIITVNGEEFGSGSNGFFGSYPLSGFFANTQLNKGAEQAFEKIEFFSETEFGPMYRAEDQRFDGTADIVYAIRTVGGLISYFDVPIGFMGDDRVPKIVWNDGTQNKTVYRMDGLGSCGGGGPEIATTPISIADLAPAGKTASGEMVYSIINKEHELIKRVFEATQGKVYEYNSETGESKTYSITPEEFIAARGVVVIPGAFGSQMIFTNSALGPQAECGKPVIYLYPEATSTISVQVDALITKSEPKYEDGWVVEATPQGVLTHTSGTYTSLFWDGYGNGVYPELEKGFVVPTADALKVMGEHLSYMGFNHTEIVEFKDFWRPHLPVQPYTRFSWIQTAEMNELAALAITPRPQTLLRAFVDFSGEDEMVTLEPQVLEQRERKGYVVTEWGGLLRK